MDIRGAVLGWRRDGWCGGTGGEDLGQCGGLGVVGLGTGVFGFRRGLDCWGGDGVVEFW